MSTNSILGNAYVRIRPDTTGFKSDAEGSISKALGGIGDLAKKLSVPVGLALGAAGALGLKTASDMEQARIGFTTMLGSAQKANDFLQKLQKFAATTPFEFPELQTAATSLISIGIDADKVIPIMTSLGNATSGMGTGSEGVKRATVALQQMNAAGKISAEDLNQLRDAGIPVFDLLSKATGKTTAQLADMAASGKLGKTELTQLMDALASGKGLERFNGLMDKQSQSLAGLFSTLKDTVQLDLAQAIQPFIPGLKSVMDQATPLIGQGLSAFADFSVKAVEVVKSTLGPGLKDFFTGGDFTGAFVQLGVPVSVVHDLETFRDTFVKIFGDIKTIVSEVGPVLGVTLGGSVRLAYDAFKLLLPVVTGFLDFLANNQAALWGFVGVMGALVAVTKAHEAAMAVSAAGGMVGWLKSTQLISSATKVWTAIQWAMNTALLSSPITWIVLGLAALVAAVVLAYQHSETFRNIVQGAFKAVGDAVGWLWGIVKTYFTFIIDFWTAVGTGIWNIWSTVIKVAWDAISTAAQWLWNSVLQPVFSAISTAWGALATAIEWAWNNIILPVWSVIQKIAMVLMAVLVVAVFGPILLAWEALSAGIQWAWANVLKPTWDAVSAAAQWLWNTILKPYFTFIVDAWTWLATTIFNVYKTILQVAWDAVATAAQWLWNNVLSPVFSAIGTGWSLLMQGIDWVWNNVLKPAWAAVQSAAQWLWNNILSPIFGAIGSAWDGLMKGMRWVYDNVIHPMWRIFGDAIGALKGAFETVVSAIGTAWDAIKGIAAKPINFVIKTVLRDGLFSAFNWVIDKLGLPGGWKIDTKAGWLQGIPGYATGGQVAGSSPHKRADNIPAMLTAGEFVQPVDTVDYYGDGFMEAIRQRRIPREALASALHLADGGPVYQQLFNRVKQQFPDARMNDGYRPGASDLHGAGKAVDLGWSKAPGGNGNAYLASMNQWLYDNFKGSILELIYDGAGDNRPDVKNGQDHNYGAALAAQHHNHVHLASNGLGEGTGGGGIGGLLGGIWDSVTRVFTHIKDSVAGPLNGLFGQFGHNLVTDVGGGLASGMPDKLWEKVKSKVGDMWDGIKNAASNVWDFVTGGDGDIKSQVQKVFASRGWGSGAEWSAADWVIGKESGWNPKAQNGVSTASGLGQFIDATWRAYRTSGAAHMKDAGIGEQAQAIARYMGDRYGDPIKTQAFWQAHNHYAYGGKVGLYDNGGVLNHGEVGLNLSRKPEAVLTNDEWKVLKDSANGGSAPLVGSLTIQVGDGASVKDGLDETMFQLRRIQRGGALR